MTISTIQRDFGPNISIVRIVTDATIEEIVATGWLATQEESIIEANNGPFEWDASDVVLVSYPHDQNDPNSIQGKAFFYVFPDFQSLNPISPIYPNLQLVTAHSGGGQTLATQLNIGINVITTSAAGGDSVKLPSDVLGQTVIVANSAANTVAIFPSLGDNIQTLGVNSPLTLTSGHSNVFFGVSVTLWIALTGL